MDRIADTFGRLRREGRKALMPYLTMGYPEVESALDLVPAIAEAGADLIELGVPFSDPLADGATIQAYSDSEYRSLLRESGFTEVELRPSLSRDPEDADDRLLAVLAVR